MYNVTDVKTFFHHSSSLVLRSFLKTYYYPLAIDHDFASTFHFNGQGLGFGLTTGFEGRLEKVIIILLGQAWQRFLES